jgi:imidazolonepropionase-like amidohydrolase
MSPVDRLLAWLKRWTGAPARRDEDGRCARAAGEPWPKLARPNATGNISGRSATFRVGWLVDGSGGPIRQGIRMDIADRTLYRISEDSAASGVPAEPPNETAGDLSDCTVIPGLVDSHVHLAMAGTMDEGQRIRLRQAPVEVVFRSIEENLREHLRYGVVAVRDAGGARGHALRFAKGPGRRTESAIRIFAAGRAWHRHGRYGRFIGRPPVEGLSLAESIMQDASPCDLVKIVNSGVNSLTEFGRRTAPQFSLEDMGAALQACGRKGLCVMVHANGEDPVGIAIGAGCRSIEHGYFMGPENLRRMAESGTVWVPTIVPMHVHGRNREPSDRKAQVARRSVDHQMEQLQRARRLNVTVALGTDSGSPGVDHGAAVVDEMKLLMAAGFSLSEAVRCASFNGAALVGEDVGLLAEGRPATFVVVPGGPSALPDSLNHVRAVYVAGERVVEAG